MLKKLPKWLSAVLVFYVVFFLGLSLWPYLGADDASAADTINRSDVQVSPIDLCNQLAEHPFDENKETEGVSWHDIDVDKALVACRQAVENQPTDPKLQFQLGRVLDRSGNTAEAASWYSKAAEQGHAQAQRDLNSVISEADARGQGKVADQGRQEAPVTSSSAEVADNRRGEDSAVTLQLSDLFENDGRFYYPVDAVHPFTGEVNSGLERGQIKDGKREGPWSTFHDNGQLARKGEFKNGQEEGPWVMYWPNGQMQSNGKYISGSEAGRWQFFHSNGELEAEGPYHSGKASGSWSFFSETGMRDEGISGVYIAGEKIPQADVAEDPTPKLTENQLSEKAQKIFSRFQSCSDEPVEIVPVLEEGSQDEPFNKILIISTHLDVECLSKLNRATERSVREALHQSVGRRVREGTEYDPSIEFSWKTADDSGHRYEVASMESPDEMGCAEFCFYMTRDIIRDSGNYYYLFYPSDGEVFAKMIAEGLISFSAIYSTHSRGTVFDVNRKKVFRTPSGWIDWRESNEVYLMEGQIILRGEKAFNWEASPGSKGWGGAFWFNSKRTIAGDIIELLDVPDGRCFKRHKFDYYLRRYLILAGKEKLCVEHHGG